MHKKLSVSKLKKKKNFEQFIFLDISLFEISFSLKFKMSLLARLDLNQKSNGLEGD